MCNTDKWRLLHAWNWQQSVQSANQDWPISVWAMASANIQSKSRNPALWEDSLLRSAEIKSFVLTCLHSFHLSSLFLESCSLADRCFPSDCAERCDVALWHRAADRQPPRGEVGSAREVTGHRAPGREPALHCPAPPQGDPHSGLPGPP